MLRAASPGPAEMFLAAVLCSAGRRALRPARAQRRARGDGGRARAARSCLLASDGRGARLRGDAAPGLRGAARAAGELGAQRGARAGVPDRLLRRRLRLCVLGVSRQRLELSRRAGRRPRRLGGRIFAAVRTRTDRLARARRRDRGRRRAGARRAARSGRDRLGAPAPAAGRAGSGDRRDDASRRPGSRSRPACSAIPRRSRSARRSSPPS